jgi:benzoyl-CoA reductase subunit D
VRITSGIDVGSSAVKTLLVSHEESGPRMLAARCDRVRHRDVRAVVLESYQAALREAGLAPEQVAYVATTGEGEIVDFRTGHFYGMTAHARGAVELVPDARAVLDIGALHARAMVIDERGKVLGYRMTSQCASGSGQFIENIGRYLGVAVEEIGPLSLTSVKPEKCSSICAVLAETDVINMVSRGLAVPDILKGIHVSMAGRFLRLLEAISARGTVVLTGGLAEDVGLERALGEEAVLHNVPVRFVSRPESRLAGALGAAIWGQYRLDKLERLTGGASEQTRGVVGAAGG